MSSKTSTNNRPSARALHRLGAYSFLVRVLLIILILFPAGGARAAPLPGFIELKVFDGLTQPTAVQFATDGRVFVAEKSGIIKVFDSLTDTTPTIFADLNVQVHNWWDRGLIDFKLDPNFPTIPYVYVSYTHDAAIGGTAPLWGTPGVYSDPCPDECVVSGRVSRLQASGNVMTGSEQVLIEDWCQQYPSHSIGSLAFGADGALYVSGGEGASFGFVDYGQRGDPVNNPCGDPPGGVGGVQTPPTAEGGALRGQDLRTSGDPVGLSGTILRVDPATGAALPDNPLAGHADPNARRIIAYGLRNPFRTAIRPGTNEVWIGDVGWLEWEELNRVVNPTDATVENFGWPCYEGPNRHAGYDSADLNICEGLYGEPGTITNPYLAYHHNNRVVPGEECGTGGSAIAGLAFYTGGNYPAEYQGALFFADYSRRCIWAMLRDANGVPTPGLVRTFVAGAAAPVDLEIGPNGDLYYVALTGSVRHIQFTSGGGGGLPSPWSSQDIGSVGVAGSASFNNGTFTVRGSGADIGGAADAFHYVYQPMSGDGSITARVATLQLKSDAAAKAGVMIRESLAANAPSAALVVMRANGVAFVRRLTAGGSSVSTAGTAAVAPHWVRLVRSGATFSAYQSSDGVNWVLVGTATISMGQNVFVGLPVTSRNNTTTTTATFDNVDVSGAPPTNQPPVASIDSPAAGTTWRVGDVINFSGSAIDPEDETLPPSAMSWQVILHHCPSNCHEHPLQTFSGV
ncbi:MAG: PQQ-dependent sugar dehydrogenase, partial [Anaerolineales bacterium]